MYIYTHTSHCPNNYNFRKIYLCYLILLISNLWFRELCQKYTKSNIAKGELKSVVFPVINYNKLMRKVSVRHFSVH